jgi:hypothetical protein
MRTNERKRRKCQMGEIHSWGHREDDVGHALANEEEVECCE